MIRLLYVQNNIHRRLLPDTTYMIYSVRVMVPKLVLFMVCKSDRLKSRVSLEAASQY